MTASCSLNILYYSFFVTQTNMTIVIEKAKVTIEVHHVGIYPLVLKRNTSKTEEPLTNGRNKATPESLHLTVG